MFPPLWGQNAWDLLHIQAMSYNPNDDGAKVHMRNFYTSMMNTLPCPKCRTDAIAYIEQYPIQLESRASLVFWVHSFHNHVNARLGKYVMTADESQQRLQGLTSIARARSLQRDGALNAQYQTRTTSAESRLSFMYKIVSGIAMLVVALVICLVYMYCYKL